MLIPRPLKKIVGVFRGQVSPTFVFLSAALGFWFGLTPGWYGVHVVLLILALVLNIHAGLFILFAGFGKALCFAAAPVLYHVGLWAQQNLAGLFGAMGAVPVLGLTDFDRCAVAGATVLGPVLGIIAGLLLARAVLVFRRTWLKLDEGSELFRAWQQKTWVRWLDWLLLGKRAADARAALTKQGRFIRPAGVVMAVVVVLASAVGIYFVQGDQLRGVVAAQLTRANGAEVSLAELDLQPLQGRVSAKGIAVTDPTALDRNRVRIDELTADAGLWNLLCGRLVLDDVVLGGVAFHETRATPGTLAPGATPAPAEAPATFDPATFALSVKDVARLAEYFKEGRDVNEQIARAAEWLPRREPAPPPPAPPERYLAYLSARGPVAPRPRIVVRRAELKDVAIPVEEFGRSTITCTSLSDAPQAAGLPVVVRIESQERPTNLEITCHYDRDEGGADIAATIGDVDLAQLQTRLSPRNPVRFDRGTATATVAGSAARETIDLRVAVETRDMQVAGSGQGLFGLDPRATDEALRVLSNVKTTLRVVGPVHEPRLAFDAEGLRDNFKTALVEAGQRELATQLDKALGDQLPAGVPKADEVLKDPLGAGQNALGGLLGGQKKKDEDQEKK